MRLFLRSKVRSFCLLLVWPRVFAVVFDQETKRSVAAWYYPNGVRMLPGVGLPVRPSASSALFLLLLLAKGQGLRAEGLIARVRNLSFQLDVLRPFM